MTFLADVVPPVTPSSSAGLPIVGSIGTVMGWLAFIALMICAASGLWSGAMMAYGHQTSRVDLAIRGKVGLLWSLAGAAVVAVAVPLVNAAYHLV